MVALQPSIVVAPTGCGLAPQTKKRAMRLARMWLLLKAQPCTIVQLARSLDVYWRTVYLDVVDLQIDPLEDGHVLVMIGAGLWSVRDIRT